MWTWSQKLTARQLARMPRVDLTCDYPLLGDRRSGQTGPEIAHQLLQVVSVAGSSVFVQTPTTATGLDAIRIESQPLCPES